MHHIATLLQHKFGFYYLYACIFIGTLFFGFMATGLFFWFFHSVGHLIIRFV